MFTREPIYFEVVTRETRELDQCRIIEEYSDIMFDFIYHTELLSC